MTDSDLSSLRRPVRCAGALVSLAVLASGGGLLYSLSRPDVGPSPGELGWQRTERRTWQYEPMEGTPGAEPRVRLQFGLAERFGLVRLPRSDREAAPYLLTRDASGSTNSTSVRIDGLEFSYGIEVGRYSRWRFRNATLPGKDRSWGGQSCMEFKDGAIRVTQTVELIAGPHTGEYDTILVRYRVANGDTEGHTVSLRVALDVRMGDNEAPPFYIPPLYENDRQLTTARLVTEGESLGGLHIPPYILALESANLQDLTSSSVALGLAEPDSLPLETVVLSRWIPQRGDPVDSYVNLIWPESNIAPGEETVMAFTYGLSRPAVDVRPQAVSRMQAVVDPPRPQPGQPFRIIACFQTRKRDGQVVLHLPPSLKLADEDPDTLNPPRGAIPPRGLDGVSRVVWWVRAAHAGHYPIRVEAPEIGTIRGWVAVGE